jgi:PAS domain S-box-containing protein
MRLIANEKSLPRIHLIGTLLIVLLLTVGLAGYHLWQSRQNAQSLFERMEQTFTEQVEASLKAEMHHAMTTIEYIRNQTEAVLRANIIQQVDNAHQIAEAIHSRESSFRSAAEVREMIVETLRPVRFYDGRGYYFIDDMNGQFILLPTSPELEGKTIIDNQDDTGHFIMRGLIATARLPRGEGFSRYRWYTPENPKVMADKVSYVRYFEPYDWLIGTGDYLYKWEEKQKLEALLHLRTHSFGRTGYVALFDASGRSLLTPSNAALENKTSADMPDFERSVLEKLLSTARAGGGIVHYDWPQADSGILAKKTAYVQTYAPWQWVIVTTQFDDEILATVAAEQQAFAQLSTRQALTITLAGLAALLIGLAASWLFSLWIRQLFEGYHRNILDQQETLRQQADALHKNQLSLRESEHHFRTLANSGLALIWTSGPDKLCNYFNEPWLRYTGRTLEQELGNGWTEGVHPDDYDRCLHIYVSHFDRREPFSMEYRLRKANGEYGWILDLGQPRYDSEGTFVGYIGFCYDTTDRKQADELLRRSEERFLLAMKASNDGLFDWNLETNEIYYSPAWKKMLGYEDHELPNDFSVWENTTDPEDVKKSWELQQKLISKQIDRFVVEFKMKHKDGHWIDILSRAEAVFNDKDQAIRIVGTHTDISERKRTEEELRESEERNRQILHSSLDGFWRVDHQTRLIEVNDAYCRMSGYSREELLTMAVRDVEALETTEAVAARTKHIIKHGSDRFTTSHRRKDGRIFEVEVSIQYRPSKDGGEFVVFLRDVTEKRHLESQLRQAQKLEAIGTLAGGIAHDFNNILGAIVGYSEMIRDDLAPESPSIHGINQVLKASHRAKDLVKQILAFSRQVEDQKIPVYPAVIVKEAITLLRSSLPVTITIEQDIDPDAGSVLADPTQFHQIVMNLCTNAFHAMEVKGGRLTIALQNIILSQDDLAAEPDLQPGKFVQLLIKDTGEGIPLEIRERIFDPFFTTKEVGKGTGLGLSMVYSIVKRSGGSITCDSRIGEGTEFRIILPALEGQRVQDNGSPERTLHGKEHILFIDDEEMLAELGEAMLKRLGYHVTTRRNSLDALTTFQNQPDTFDLVITDQTMPGITGVDLARHILQIRPQMPIILCTGYSSQISEETAKAVGIKGFAFKPITKKDIGELIRTILDGPPDLSE